MNKLTMKMRLFAAFLLLGLWGATAQTAREQIAAMPERAGGIYHSYEYLPGPAVPAPKGYVPFYISHYGRHGSRWHTSEKIYAEPLGILRKADSAGVLTPKGRDLLAKVEVIAADARDRYGDLSPRGVAEHRGIAERMYKAYPEVFSTGDGRECFVQSRSTLVPRCILSMAAFNERLKELNPEIRMTRESSQRYIPYMSNGAGLNSQRKASGAVADSLQDARTHPARLMASLFSDPAFVEREVKRPAKLMNQLLAQAAIMQDVEYLGISLYDLFTEEEIYAAWEAENFRRYVMFGPSKRFGDPIIADAKPLLRNIVETAERVVGGGGEPLGFAAFRPRRERHSAGGAPGRQGGFRARMDGRGSCRGVADTPRIAHGDQRAVHLLPQPRDRRRAGAGAAQRARCRTADRRRPLLSLEDPARLLQVAL